MDVDIAVTPSQAIARPEVAAVSFALAGVLLLRRCLGREGVFERAVQLAPLPARLKQIPESFIQHRNLAQNRLRIVRQEKTVAMATGVTIEAIYDQFAVHAFGLPPAIRPSLVEAELAAECELAVLNPAMLPLIDQARRLGRKVGVVAESHWSSARISSIIAAVAPDLRLDFVHSSADFVFTEGGDLFRRALAAESLRPGQLVHIGVDEDTIAQPLDGLTMLTLPAAAEFWDAEKSREQMMARLIAGADRGFDWRLDGGFNLLREAALAEIAPAMPHLRVGAAVIGPLMVGFQHLIECRVAELSRPGRSVRLLFLARDGYLPMRLWSAAGAGPFDYVEVNRRIALVAGGAGAGGIDTMRGLFRAMAFVRPSSIEDFFKISLSDEARAFFDDFPDRLCPGPVFADAMIDLLGKDSLDQLSETLRGALLDYLTARLGPLDQITDMVLADIGYTGNIQHGLRRVFDLAGLNIAVHGLYLMPQGEMFVDLPGEDSVAGYLDDSVLTPGMKRAIMRDAPLIEEFCCAPVGSTKGYIDGKEVREPEVRLPEEIAFCLEMQDEAIRYADAVRRQAQSFDIDPLADFARYRAWSAAVLARYVMMPTQLECQTFGPLLHDVSLGSRGLIATITTADIRNLMGALPFPTVCSIHHPPVWLGGSLAAHSGIAGFAYAMTGMGLPTDSVLNDVSVGDGEALLVKDDRVQQLPMSLSLTPFGDLRVRVPVLQRDGDSVIALRLLGPMRKGIIRSAILQGGATIGEATMTRHGTPMAADIFEAANAILDGSFFRGSGDDALLLVKVPPLDSAVNVVTLLLTPLFDD